MVGKVLGIGGVFFRSSDTEALAKWYETHLGVPGFWQQEAGMTVFAPFKEDDRLLSRRQAVDDQFPRRRPRRADRAA